MKHFNTNTVYVHHLPFLRHENKETLTKPANDHPALLPAFCHRPLRTVEIFLARMAKPNKNHNF